MGTSTRYRDQPTGELPDQTPSLAVARHEPDPAPPDEAILTALARAEASLRVVLAAIAELKDEMNQHPQPADATQLPDTSWVGTP